MTHKSSPVGNEITCIMYGIKDAILNDVKKLEKDLVEAANHENFQILNAVSYVFQPQGFTAMLLLGESHIAIHTYPEYNCLVFNLYSCRGPEDGRKTLDFFIKSVLPENVDTRENKVRIGREDKNND
ncbi:adenosylmethionine decarboxylase [Patescibacteria group bacterium]|nr:adenosylmethionine decarboxylase [Patescibacteria group bacterium]